MPPATFHCRDCLPRPTTNPPPHQPTTPQTPLFTQLTLPNACVFAPSRYHAETSLEFQIARGLHCPLEINVHTRRKPGNQDGFPLGAVAKQRVIEFEISGK
ncbi:hypothetical protein E2C01_027726 [Portunus trituberculatus]|uniref:Uncharacterized protein n=1 Tax=Portunus trituberculatus TaxID=210409 RepID=A0A5B7EIW0_PORTR|nr:hypothetical protein [Portunus trituberculatus]